MRTKYLHGFSLIEVLLAMVLLSAGLALAFASLRSATAVATRGELIVQRNERIRAVEGFLRRRLVNAQPIVYSTDPELGEHRFSGERTRMRFVSDLPDYLGRGGPHLHDLAVVDDGRRLVVDFAMVQGGDVVKEREQRTPEILADGLRAVTFRYRGLAESGGELDDWQETWENPQTLPIQVRIDIHSAEGEPWPPMIVTLARGGASDERGWRRRR